MNLNVSISPHIHTKTDTVSIMRDVIIALMPALAAAVFLFGARSLLIAFVSVAAAVLCEYVFQKGCRRPVTVSDLSAVVTGLLLAYNLPPTIPLWQAALGSIVAVLVAKQLFGGLGRNFANPAIVGRIVLFLSFSNTMTDWVIPGQVAVDAVTAATPLSIMEAGGTQSLSLSQLFFGQIGGCMGEVSALAILIGFVYLLVRRVITWHTPVVMVGTVFLCSWMLEGSMLYALYQVLSGGLLQGAVFMATDYATTPSTRWGQILFGLGAGLLTVLIRQWGNYIEGVSFAILFMNILTPYLSKWTRSKPLGGVRA